MEKATTKDDETIAFLVETLEHSDSSLDPESLLVAAKARGHEIQPHHIHAAFEVLQQLWKTQGELDDDALDRVAGGVDLRSQRDQDKAAFQAADQKSNQTMNLLSNLVKTMNEMRSIGAASRSGL
jgi:hypothetical protein